MRSFFVLLLVSLSFVAFCRQPNSSRVLLLSKKTAHQGLDWHWLFHYGDLQGGAAATLDDSSWPMIDPQLVWQEKIKKPTDTFQGIAWFRLHLKADTTLAGHIMAAGITHMGASEIYLDGKKLKSFGTINGKTGSEYRDPQRVPFTFLLPDTFEHVLAIRYANFNARHNNAFYQYPMAGFRMDMAQADDYVAMSRSNSVTLASIFSFLFGLFLTLSVIHLLLFLFHRTDISNLYFSLFAFSIGALFYIAMSVRFTNNPPREMLNDLLAIFVTFLLCFSLSGFNNALFARNKLRFRIIAGLCLLLPVLALAGVQLDIAAPALIAIVMLESVILTIRAMVRKVKGAGIIGAGVLFFGLFFLMVMALALSAGGNIEFNDSDAGGQLLELASLGAILCMPLSMSVYQAWKFAVMNKDLAKQVNQVQLLSEKTLEQEREKQVLLESRREELEKEVTQRTEEVLAQKEEIERQHEELKVEKDKSDNLLLNILPAEIAEELKESGSSEARLFDHVTVLFTDFVDFTKAGEKMTPRELVEELDTCFKAFDDIISRHRIEKIKTIGDAYLAVCGLPAADDKHALKAAQASIEIRDFMVARKKELGDKTFEVRIGLHSGSVVAGIVGVKKFAYDIWGDTVNTAARMEQNSTAGKINCSQNTFDLIADHFNCTFRGEIEAKNKGALKMYFVEPLN